MSTFVVKINVCKTELRLQFGFSDARNLSWILMIRVTVAG